MRVGGSGGRGGTADSAGAGGDRNGSSAATGSATTFGPYRIDTLLGRGGMGQVHQAFDTRKQRAVALKRLPVSAGEQEGFEARFRREAELAGRLSEPHVIPIHDFGEIDGQLFIDMRLVEGTDLATVLARHGPLAPARAVDICRQVAQALDAAHRAGLVHRDVKPSNILLSGPQDDFVYLIDFGIASSVTSTRLTSTGMTIGTALYMAPERFTGRDDHRVDIYALCCVLHEALTGAPPFTGPDFPSLMYAHVNTPAPPLRSRRPELPPRLEAVLARGLAKNPDERQQRAEELAADLGTALGRDETLVGSSATTVERPGAPQRPWNWILAAGVCAIVAVAAVTIAVVVLVTQRGPGSPDAVATRSVNALAAKNAGELDAVGCRRPDGRTSVQLPANILGLVQSAQQTGPVSRTLESEARVTANLTLSSGGQTQSAPVDLVLAVNDHAWCLNNIEAKQ